MFASRFQFCPPKTKICLFPFWWAKSKSGDQKADLPKFWFCFLVNSAPPKIKAVQIRPLFGFGFCFPTDQNRPKPLFGFGGSRTDRFLVLVCKSYRFLVSVGRMHRFSTRSPFHQTRFWSPNQILVPEKRSDLLFAHQNQILYPPK